jgi:hypothetical protein
MATYFNCSKEFIKVKADMNEALNTAYSTTGQDYPSKDWADDVNLLGALPSGMTRAQYMTLINGGA